MADDVEWQLAWLGAEQLGLQEGGPLLLQQLFTTHIVLGEPMESRVALHPPLPTPIGSLAASPPPDQGQTLQTLATRDMYSSSKKSNSLAVSSKKK